MSACCRSLLHVPALFTSPLHPSGPSPATGYIILCLGSTRKPSAGLSLNVWPPHFVDAVPTLKGQLHATPPSPGSSMFLHAFTSKPSRSRFPHGLPCPSKPSWGPHARGSRGRLVSTSQAQASPVPFLPTDSSLIPVQSPAPHIIPSALGLETEPPE